MQGFSQNLPVAVVFAAALLPAHGATFSVNPSADAFVSSANASGNFGNAGALAVSAAGLPKGEFNTLLRFDLASAKAGFDSAFGAGQWALDSASFRLTLAPPNNIIFNGNGAGPGGTNVNLAGTLGARWLANDSWLEGTGGTGLPTTDGVAFQDVPGLQIAGSEALGTLAFAGGTSGNITVALAITPGFAADVSAGGNVTLLLRPEDSVVSVVANSRQASNPANRPMLTLNASAIPEPSALLLASVAACALVVRRHRPAGRNQLATRPPQCPTPI